VKRGILIGCVLVGAWTLWVSLARSGGPGEECESNPALYSLDCNGDGAVDISDPVCTLNWLFSGGPPPRVCLAQGGTRDRYLWVPAGAFVFEADADTSLEGQGLRMAATFMSGISATVAVPDDWDRDSSFSVDIYFYPNSSGSGNVDFFMRPRGRVVGDPITDPGSISSDAPVAVANQQFRIFRQRFTIPAGRLPLASELFQLFGIQRGGTGETFADDVTVLGVRINYTATQ
jgi:hypothetical protein